MTETSRGALLMLLAMVCFAIEDGLIKGLAGVFSPAQIIWMLGLGGALAFAAWLKASGQALWSPLYLDRKVLLRSAFEMVGALCFVTALALLSLALAAAIIQATPLTIAMGAALFLGARVGWRRWLAIAVGFVGVLIIIRPGGSAFEPGTLFAVFGMLALAARDLITRYMPPEISGARLSLHAFAALVPGGLVVQAALGIPVVVPDTPQLGVMAFCIVFSMVGYLAVVAATRLGDISVVSSFRYSRMLFALIVGMVAFGEQPDEWTLIGVSIVIASGVYTLIREARLRSASQA